MSQENPHEPNSGVLFTNSDEWVAAKENRPNLGGEVMIECLHCKKLSRMSLSGWRRVGKSSGKKFLSLAFSLYKPKKEKGEPDEQ
jgi:hypothetical protein